MTSRTDFFLQIRNVVGSLVKEKKLRFGLSQYSLISSITIKGKISEVYGILSTTGHSCFLTLLKIWEKDLGLVLSENSWSNICGRIHFT